MTTKDIRTSHAHTVCDVCGRTLLRGERAEIYINGGARRSVCELCRPRALHEGWIREGTLPDYNQSGAGTERRRSLLNRLRRRDARRRRPSLDDELAGYEPPPEPEPSRRSRFQEDELPDERWGGPPAGAASESPAPYRAHPPEDEWDDGYALEPDEFDQLDEAGETYEPEEPSEPYEPGDHAHLDDPYAQPEAPPESPSPGRRPWSRPPRSLRDQGQERPPRSSRRPPRRAKPDQSRDRAERGQAREPRHVRAVPSGPEQKMAAAVELFNQSEHRRTVAGVARSLGGAGVAVLPAADPPSLVHIVVWWELCWYRYTVDLSDEVPGVRVDGQGYELEELSDAERSANATADESGQLILS